MSNLLQLNSEHFDNEIQMDLVEIGCAHKIGAFSMERMRYEKTKSAIGDEIIYRLVTQMVAEALTPKTETNTLVEFDKTVEVDLHMETVVPLSWWQHFKRDCFPQWMLKIWPVKWEVKNSVERKKFIFKGRKKVDVKVLATYPKFNQVVPDLGHSVIKAHVLGCSDVPMNGTCDVEVTEIKEGETNGKE